MNPALDARPSVWLVEDDEEVLRLLVEVFEGSSLRVEAFSSERVALERANRVRPDVLVLDWHLARMNGRLFLERLREKSGELPPVVVLTGDVRLQAESAGVCEVFRKPVRLDSLVSRVLQLSASRAHAGSQPQPRS